jgi:hypothetical protein
MRWLSQNFALLGPFYAKLQVIYGFQDLSPEKSF